MSKAITYSRNLAFTIGVLVPVAETIRRRGQLLQPENFIYWFDDYVLGAILLFAAWKAKQNPVHGQKYLSAAWGLATGALFLSMLGQIERLGGTDPSAMPPLTVAAIKALLLVLALSGLITSLYRIK